MRFTDAERAKRYRDGRSLRGIKTFRFDVDISKVSEDVAVKEIKVFIKKLENENVNLTR